MTDETPDPCGSVSSAELGYALDAARLALPEFSQQDDYLLAHGASLMSEHSHEILHRDTLRRIVSAAVAAERERCAQVCDRVQLYHAQMAIAADDEETADFHESEACGAEDCAEALRMGERWFPQPNTRNQAGPEAKP